jgi:hypothetical protein
MSGEIVDTNVFGDVEVTNLGVLITDELIIEKRSGEQYNVLTAITEAFLNTSVVTANLSDHLIDELPFDLSGYWPLYSVEANAQAASNTGTTTVVGANWMPNLTNASSADGVDYFLGTHVDQSLEVETFVINGSTDSNIDHKLTTGGITIFSEDVSGWFSEFTADTNFDVSGFVDSSGGLRGVVSASEGLYIKYPDASGLQYINVIPALTALLGLSAATPYVSTGTERESLHRFSYSIDFDVEIPISIEAEIHLPDFELSNQGVDAMKFIHNEIGISVNDDPSGNRIQAVNGNLIEFDTPSLETLTIEPKSARAQEYADNWLDLSGHSFHTLIKGLFGQMLLDSGTVPVELTLDTSGTNGEAFIGYITDDSLQLNVSPKKVGWVESGVDVSGQSYFQDEHDNLTTSLQNAFRDIWDGANKDDNIDWYAALYNKTQTGPLFINGDIFSIPVELTMRFTISSGNEPGPGTPLQGYTDSGGADDGKLTPLAISITNVVTATDQTFEEKWRFVYNFRAQ